MRKLDEYVVRAWKENGYPVDLVKLKTVDMARVIAVCTSKDSTVPYNLVEVLQTCESDKGERTTLWHASFQDGKLIGKRNL